MCCCSCYYEVVLDICALGLHSEAVAISEEEGESELGDEQGVGWWWRVQS